MWQKMLQVGSGGSSGENIKYHEQTFANVVNGSAGNSVVFSNTLSISPSEIKSVHIKSHTMGSGTTYPGLCSFELLDNNVMQVRVSKTSGYNTATITYGIYYV